MKTYCFSLYLLLKVIYPLQVDQMRSSDNRVSSCSTFTLHDLQHNSPYPGHLGLWKGLVTLAGVDNYGRKNIGRNSFLQRFLKSCLTFITPLYEKEFPHWHTLLTQTWFPHMESWCCFLSVQNSFFYISRDTSQSLPFDMLLRSMLISGKKNYTIPHFY